MQSFMRFKICLIVLSGKSKISYFAHYNLQGMVKVFFVKFCTFTKKLKK